MKKAEEFVYRAVEEGQFEIDAQGRVWRTAIQRPNRWGKPSKIVHCKRKRAEIKNGCQYLQIRVMYEGVLGVASAHRLVWFHFNGSIPEHLTVNHKDGNKHNNHPNNLELATHAEQTRHAMKVLGWWPRGRIPEPKYGSDNPKAKLNLAAVSFIRKSAATGISLAKKYGVSCATISRVRTNTLWRIAP